MVVSALQRHDLWIAGDASAKSVLVPVSFARPLCRRTGGSFLCIAARREEVPIALRARQGGDARRRLFERGHRDRRGKWIGKCRSVDVRVGGLLMLMLSDEGEGGGGAPALRDPSVRGLACEDG